MTRSLPRNERRMASNGVLPIMWRNCLQRASLLPCGFGPGEVGTRRMTVGFTLILFCIAAIELHPVRIVPRGLVVPQRFSDRRCITALPGRQSVGYCQFCPRI